MKEDPDSLRSTQTVEIVDLWCEGEIQGLVNGLKSVYLDGVPIENADGSRNFEEVRFEYVKGTQGQAALSGFDSVQNEVGVGVVVTHATPVVRTISDADVDTVRVTISLGQLTHQKSNGDLKGSQFEYVIEVQSAGGGFVERVRDVVKGKRTNGYKRAKKIALTGPAPWDIRVRRISVDAPTLATQNAFAWESYTEIKSLRLRYPNSAVSGLRFSAQQSNRIPGRAFDIMAMRVQVPSNWDPLTRVYTGTWDGTFVVDWTDNPAWIFRETATHPRWGLGRFVAPELLNKWVLYRIAQYCDGMVSDGRGGLEPRFTCNLYLQTREQAIKVLQDLAAVFRGICYWAGGQLQTVQDAPSDPVMLFTPANVVDGVFQYQTSSEVGRHSVFIVHYNDLGQLGKRVPEVYSPPELVARYGIRELELSPIGVNSRGQAHRLARWAAYTEEMEGETVSFRVGAEGAVAMPGQVLQIADPTEAGERLGGRIHAATASAVTLDAEVELASGEDYTLTVQVQDPDDGARYITQERAVTNGAGPATVLNVSPAFSSAPPAQGTWLLQSTAVAATTWRCLAVAEVDGQADQFEVLAVAHHPGKFALIEQDVALQLRPVSRVALTPPPPTGPLLLTETPYRVGTIYRSRVSMGWGEPVPGLHYQVSWRQDDGPWHDLPLTSANEAEVEGLPVGLLEVRVRSQNALGNGSGALPGTLALQGKTAPPTDVAGLVALVEQGGVRLRWTAAPDPDYLATTLILTDDGSTLFEGAADSFLWPWPPLGEFTVTAVHWDTSLNPSATPESVTFTVDESIRVQWANLSGVPAAKLFNNLVDPGWWRPGAAWQWAHEEDPAGESAIVWGPGPKGATQALWRAVAAGTPGVAADGGWKSALASAHPTNAFEVDPAKTYRFAVPVYRESGTGGSYWGASTTGVLCDLNTAVPNANPYFCVAYNLPVGRWFLMVGYVFPAGATGLSNDGAGVYDMSTGALHAAGLNFNWAASAGECSTRAFQFYCSTGAAQRMAPPMVHLVDGAEPSLKELLQPSALLNTMQEWEDVQHVPYSLVFNNDDSVALGYNPTFSDWPDGQMLPTGWTDWVNGALAARETVLVRAGQYAVKFDTGGPANVNVGMLRYAYWTTAPMAAGTFLMGTVDLRVVNRVAGDRPGLLVVLYTNAALTTYVAVPVRPETAAAGEWQRVPWSARVGPAERIYGMVVYVMASWSGFAGGPFQGVVVFDNLRFAFFDQSTDNTSVAINADGTLANAGGGQVTITGLGYAGALNATADLSLVAGGAIALQGNRAKKTLASNAWGDAQVYSRDGYAGGAFATAVAVNTSGRVMFGLNTDPAADASYSSIDHAVYLDGGTLRVYESGGQVYAGSGYAVGDVFAVAFDGFRVRYLKNGAVVYTSAVLPSAGTTFFFDSAFYDIDAEIAGVRFVPMSTVAGIDTPQIAPGAVTNVQPRTEQVEAAYYSGSPVSFVSPQYMDGPTITTTANGRILASFTGRMGVYLDSSADRWCGLYYKLQLIRVSDNALMDESASVPAQVFSVKQTILTPVARASTPCAACIPFDAVPAGTYKVRVEMSADCTSSTGNFSANITQLRAGGEIGAIEFKV